jgi:hypothetical protein
MDENDFLGEDEEVSAPILKRVLTDQQKEAAKVQRKKKTLERQQDPEEDEKFKAKQRTYYAMKSAETKIENKIKRVEIKTSNKEKYVELKAREYIPRSEEQIEQYKINRNEEAVENDTEFKRAVIRQVR